MKKKIIGVLFALTLIFTAIAFTSPAILSVSAEDFGYGIFVGGTEITEANASDVLEDGTVSYDKDSNTLTLNNANFSTYYTAQFFDETSYFGIYSEKPNFKIKLIGENTINTTVIIEGKEHDSTLGIYSSNSLEIFGEGSLLIKSWGGIICTGGNLLIKDCTAEFNTATAVSVLSGNVTFDNATLSAKYILAMAISGDILVKDTTVTEGGSVNAFVSMQGDITIKNSSVAINSAITEDIYVEMNSAIYASEGDVVVEDSQITVSARKESIIYSGGSLLSLKNTVVNVNSSLYAFFAENGKIDLDGVSGSVEVIGESALGFESGLDLEVKNCDLSVSCRASEDTASAFMSIMNVKISNSKLRISTRSNKESSFAIANPVGTGNVTAENSQLDISTSGLISCGIYGVNVTLVNCVTGINSSSPINEHGTSVGVGTEDGTIMIKGGVLNVSAVGPKISDAPFTTHAIWAGNPLFAPIFIDVDLTLRGNQAISAIPDLSAYDLARQTLAYTDTDGMLEIEFNKENLTSIKYLRIQPVYTISFNANGGSGTMEDITDFYGELNFPENEFTPPANKIFVGWALSSDGEIIEFEFTPHANTTLYAIWEEKQEELPPESESEEKDSSQLSTHDHYYGDKYVFNATHHWKECACKDKTLLSSHSDANKNGKCDVCGSKMPKKKGCNGEFDGGSAVFMILSGFSVFWFIVKKKKFTDN